jgi:flagellar M-ring protein FliF
MENQKSLTQNKYKQKLEEDYEDKIVALLEPFVGAGRVVARVSLDLEFKKRHIQEEIYEPEGTIRSQQTTESTASSTGNNGQTGGTAGVENNIQTPDGANGNASTQSNNESAKTITNYEISKKLIEEKSNNYSQVKRVTAAVTFDSSILADVQNRDEFLASIESVVQDTIGFDENRGDKITVRDFKFLNTTTTGNQQVDVNGNTVQSGASDGDVVDTLAMVKSILRDFSEYFQYLIAAILLFYKKFIVNHEVVVIGENGQVQKIDKDGNPIDDKFIDEFMSNYEDEFDASTAQGRLKAKVKSQILNNLQGLDEENAAKYEILIEALDKEINNSPEEIARMIELLLTEGSGKFK